MPARAHTRARALARIMDFYTHTPTCACTHTQTNNHAHIHYSYNHIEYNVLTRSTNTPAMIRIGAHPMISNASCHK